MGFGPTSFWRHRRWLSFLLHRLGLYGKVMIWALLYELGVARYLNGEKQGFLRTLTV